MSICEHGQPRGVLCTWCFGERKDPSVTEPVLRITIPTHDGRIDQHCVLGMMDASRHWPVIVDIVQGSFLPRSRDLIIDRFAKDERATHLLCVDSDIAFSAEHVERLLELDVDFAFGLYHGKSERAPFMCSRRLSSPGAWGIEDAEAVRYDRCGAGFVLLTKSCVARMLDAYGPSESYVDPAGRPLVGLWQTSGRVDQDGRMVAEGEDFAFCRRWRALGGDIWTRTDVVLGHVGSRIW